jgi:hypothetical protein
MRSSRHVCHRFAAVNLWLNWGVEAVENPKTGLFPASFKASLVNLSGQPHGPLQAPRSVRCLLNAAAQPQDMNLPGLRLHELSGKRSGVWSVWVSGNWRVTFRFDGEHGFTPEITDGWKELKTSDPAWRLYAAFSGCGTAQCSRTDRPWRCRASRTSCDERARA